MTQNIFLNGNVVSERVVDIIWNMSLVCPWDCSICCVDAVHVAKQNNHIHLRSNGLQKIETIPFSKNHGTIYDQAMAYRQQQGLELDLEGKIQVLNNLDGFLPKIDFSGGDPLAVSENLEVMKIASNRFGRQQITLTATGAGLAQCDPAEIAPLIGELNFTYDSVTHEGGENRPTGYAIGNLKKATEFAKIGVKTRGECPLTVGNIADSTLRQLYLNLHENGIDKLLIMRLFPVGRGTLCVEDIPSIAQYRRAINILREMEMRYGSPVVKLQCALKWLDTQSFDENPCDVVRESFGLSSNGTLLASPWAVNNVSTPLDDAWVLGNLSRTPLTELLATKKVTEYEARLDENYGHCKIFSFLHSNRERGLDRIFDKSDPLVHAIKPLTVLT